MHVSLQGEQQISEQPLVHWGPLELRDAEHGGPRAGAKLPTLLFGHRHAPEAQVHTQVPLQLGSAATVEGLLNEGTRECNSNLLGPFHIHSTHGNTSRVSKTGD